MSRLLFDRQWTFTPGIAAHYYTPPEKKYLVDLPHDFSIGMPRDPNSRGGAHNGFFVGDVASWAVMTEDFAKPLDVVGYNYMYHRYGNDAKRYPDRLICGTETYPMAAFDTWEATEANPNVIGDFVWTALDYLGEAGIGAVRYESGEFFLGEYPWHQANCGDIDICGVKRPQSYYRDCVWGRSTEPYIAVYNPEHYGKAANITRWGWPDVKNSWTWDGFEGKPIVVDVYCMNDEVELICNGKSLGIKKAGKANKYITQFETVYEPGELTAIGYDNGRPVSRSSVRTASKPCAIRLTADKARLQAKFGELSYIKAEVIDENGYTVDNATNQLYFTVCGVGSLLAVGNSNPKSDESYIGNTRCAHNGWAMAVIRGDGHAGDIVLTVSGEGLQTAQLTIRVE